MIAAPATNVAWGPYRSQTSPASTLAASSAIPDILRNMQALRFADETIYLRGASINIFNGLISLTFSCDGSHYMPWHEFLDKNVGFWVGTAA